MNFIKKLYYKTGTIVCIIKIKNNNCAFYIPFKLNLEGYKQLKFLKNGIINNKYNH